MFYPLSAQPTHFGDWCWSANGVGSDAPRGDDTTTIDPAGPSLDALHELTRCFLEWIEITFLVLPLFTPIILDLDFGNGFSQTELLVWFAIAVAVNLQTSFMTPPFGFSLFYVKRVALPDVPIQTIDLGAVPFVVLQLGLAAVIGLPALTIGVARAFG